MALSTLAISLPIHLVFLKILQVSNCTVFCVSPYIRINAPSLLIAPSSSVTLQNSYFGVLHPSQQPTLLRFRDSEKRGVLVLPQSNTA